jgi:hypothetical protein
MIFLLQLVFALLGGIILKRGRIRLGRQEVSSSVVPLVGGLLVAPLPICLFVWIVLFIPALFVPSIKVPTHHSEPGLEGMGKRIESLWWINPAITVGLISLAGAMAAMGLREEDAELLAGGSNAGPPDGEN